MAIGRRGVIALAAAGAAVALALVGGGVVLVNTQADAAAATAYESAADEVREAAAKRDAAAKDLVAAQQAALTTRAAGAALVAAADPGMLADPATRDALQKAVDALVLEAGLTTAADGTVTAPKPPAASPVPELDPPEGRDARLAAAEDVRALAAPLLAEAGKREKTTAAIRTASAAVDGAGVALVTSAHAKGLETAVPDLAAQETKDAWVAAVAALQKPKAGADLAALVTAYQAAWAAVVASNEEAVRSQSPDSVEPTYINGILVVNKTYGLPSWYGDGLTGETLDAFAAMRAEAASLGYDLYISSGFRSYWDQQAIYNRYVANDGQAVADTYSARPGHSEHQTGLTFDLNCICEDFGYQADGQWVAANAHRFGFIVRYPPGKEGVTGYIWEPWHLRYLGVDVATAVYNSGLTLEEYLGVTSSYG